MTRMVSYPKIVVRPPGPEARELVDAGTDIVEDMIKEVEKEG